jgi:hypothetical protein
MSEIHDGAITRAVHQLAALGNDGDDTMREFQHAQELVIREPVLAAVALAAFLRSGHRGELTMRELARDMLKPYGLTPRQRSRAPESLAHR